MTPEDKEKLEKLEELQKQRIYEAWMVVLSNKHGRRVIYNLLAESQFSVSAFGGDADSTLFNSGKQAVGEYIIGMLNAYKPDAYHLMLKEVKEDEDHARSTIDKLGDTSDYNPGDSKQ